MTLNLLNQPVSAQPGPLADPATVTSAAVPGFLDERVIQTFELTDDQAMLAVMTGLPEGTRPKWSNVVDYVHELKRQRKRPYVITICLRTLTNLYDRLYPGPPFRNPFFQAEFSLFFARELRLPRTRRTRPA